MSSDNFCSLIDLMVVGILLNLGMLFYQSSPMTAISTQEILQVRRMLVIRPSLVSAPIVCVIHYLTLTRRCELGMHPIGSLVALVPVEP